MLIEIFSSFVQFDSSLDRGQILTAITSGVAIIFVILSCCAAWFVRGSTAVPAALWSAAASLFFSLSTLQQATENLDIATLGIHRVVIAALSVCPVMSLLGAKRPQHGIWQFIVGTLAAVLALPAASAILIHPGSLPDLHILGRFFLPVLVSVGWMNFIGTRRAVAATLIAVGHFGLIWPLLPGIQLEAALLQPARDLVAISFMTAGSFLALSQAVFARLKRKFVLADGVQLPLDNLQFEYRVNTCFLALRETLGAAWTLRLAERFDQMARRRGWPVQLTFQGLQMQEEPREASWEPDALRAMEALMKRFVSSAWLERHGWAVFPFK
ncbi:MAG TPA: hypothetical protein DEB70_08755 [Planctomycetaceae bacterium]|nr:hypothetical protein [Planctomycetaceae bacterium]